MAILKDIFLYMSQFVPKAAVCKLFVLGSGKGYDSLRREAMTAPDHNRIEHITDFIFGIDDEAVRKRISAVTGLYMFVDYSTISSSISTIDVKTDSFRLAVTVAHPTPEDQDQATELLWQDRALSVMRCIRRQMRDDFDRQKAVFWLEFPTTIQPFVAHQLANSIGWTMEFDVRGIDMV